VQVSHDGGLPEEQTLATLSPLETGRVGLTYNYIPPGDGQMEAMTSSSS